MPVDRKYNDEMISIIRSSPIHAGKMRLYFDLSPDVFRMSELKYSEHIHLGFFLKNELKGFASLGYHDALIGGELQKVFTIYHFYLKQEARGSYMPLKAGKLFVEDASFKSNFGSYVTMKGNRQVEIFIGRQGSNWTPPSRIMDELVVKSILFSFPKRNNTAYTLRNAQPNDIPEIVRLLNGEHSQRDFGQVFSVESFQRSLTTRGLKMEDYYVASDRHGKIKGVCLAWDCSAFRRTVLLNYTGSFIPQIVAYKVLEKILPMAPFPAKGESFNELTITDYATEDRDVTIMHALLAEIYHRNLNRKYHVMNFGSCGSDPLLKAVKGFWHRDIVSNMVLISLHPEKQAFQPRLPYVDIALL